MCRGSCSHACSSHRESVGQQSAAYCIVSSPYRQLIKSNKTNRNADKSNGLKRRQGRVITKRYAMFEWIRFRINKSETRTSDKSLTKRWLHSLVITMSVTKLRTYWFIKHINVDGWIGHQFNHVAARFVDWWVPETSRRCPRPLHQVRYQTDTAWIHFITGFWFLSPQS